MNHDRYHITHRFKQHLVDLRLDLEAYWIIDSHGGWRLVVFYDTHNCVYHDLGDRIILSYSSELEGGV